MVRSSKLDNYLTGSNLLAGIVFSQCETIVAVSNGIKQLIEEKYKIENCICIENNYTHIEIDEPYKEDNYILFLGRVNDKIKNISLLIDSYKLSGLEGVCKLIIVGSGPDCHIVSSKIGDLKLEKSIKHISFTKDVGNFIYKARFLVLTSRYEGFPRVLIESLSLGTPVVSVDCRTGPSEIVQHEKNGLLVENHNEKALADAMRRMVFDHELYKKCKENAKQSVSHLSFESISKKWVELLYK